MTDTPAGWYPDGQGGQRWWDGTQWTEHTMPTPDPAPTSAEPAAPVEPAATEVDPHDAPTQLGAPPRPADTGGVPEQGAYPQQGGYPPQQGGYPPQGAYPQQPGYPPQQGGYQQQPGYPPQQSTKRGGLSGKLIGIIGGGVVAVIVVIVLLVVLLGGGGAPKDVVADYFGKLQDRDCSFVELLSADVRESEEISVTSCEDDQDEAFFEDGLEDCDLEVTDEKIDGDKATIEFEVTGPDDCEESGSLDLVKEDGDWKVDF